MCFFSWRRLQSPHHSTQIWHFHLLIFLSLLWRESFSGCLARFFFNWCTSWSFHLLRFHCTLLYFAYFSTSVNLFFFSPFLIKNIYFFAVFMFTSQPVPLLFGLQPPTVDERETLCRTVCYIAYMFIILCVNRKKNTYITHTWRKMCECVSSSRIYSDPVYLFILFSQGLT